MFTTKENWRALGRDTRSRELLRKASFQLRKYGSQIHLKNYELMVPRCNSAQLGLPYLLKMNMHGNLFGKYITLFIAIHCVSIYLILCHIELIGT